VDYPLYFFTLEFLRIISIKKTIKSIFDFYGIIDLIATITHVFFVILLEQVYLIVRALRLLRLFKILKHPQFSIHTPKEEQGASKREDLIFIYFMLISSIM
jgi:voltage-gated potassium channel